MQEEQAGFWNGRGSNYQIFVLRLITKQYEEFWKTLVMSFVDFKKTFDSIHRSNVWRVFEHYGIPDKIINIVKDKSEGI